MGDTETVSMILSIVLASYHRSTLYTRAKCSLGTLPKNVELIEIIGVKGLAKARNLGWKKARGRYVAYLDDDACASPAWVRRILGFIASHPNVVAFGGPYTALNQETLPVWIPAEVVGKKLPGTRPRPLIIPHEWLNGTNMIFAKSVLKKLGGFNETLGVNGEVRAYGEETDLQIRLHNAGYEIWYLPNLTVQHEFMLWKQNLYFLLKDQYLHGRGSRLTFAHLQQNDTRRAAETALGRLFAPRLHWQTRVYYFFAPLAYLLGKTIGIIKS